MIMTTADRRSTSSTAPASAMSSMDETNSEDPDNRLLALYQAFKLAQSAWHDADAVADAARCAAFPEMPDEPLNLQNLVASTKYRVWDLSEAIIDGIYAQKWRRGFSTLSLDELVARRDASITIWKEWKAQRQCAFAKHRVDELEAAAGVAEECYDQAFAAFIQEPAQTLWGVALKLAWSCSDGSSFHEDAQKGDISARALLAALADVQALSGFRMPA